MRGGRRLHPAHVLAIVDVSEQIDGRLSDNDGHAENGFLHFIIPRGVSPNLYIIARKPARLRSDGGTMSRRNYTTNADGKTACVQKPQRLLPPRTLHFHTKDPAP